MDTDRKEAVTEMQRSLAQNKHHTRQINRLGRTWHVAEEQAMQMDAFEKRSICKVRAHASGNHSKTCLML